MFFSKFCNQVPLVHPATWKMEDKPSVLCKPGGALFVKTPAAAAFIDETLATRDYTDASNPLRQKQRILETRTTCTVVLLQTIGLFHQKADQRISSNVYHDMLVMASLSIGLFCYQIFTLAT
jgi:hypothetical protein